MGKQFFLDLSGGLASACALFRAIDRYGLENVTARFADTMYESVDTYQFIDHIVKLSGVELITFCDGRDIWDVFMDRGMLTDIRSGACMASYWLKKMPLWDHSKQNLDSTVLIGYGPDECDRVEKLEAFHSKKRTGISFDYPLRWKPKAWFCDVKRELEEVGVKIWPQAYDEGMGHNNCNRQCIKGGISYWSLLWKDYPDRFLYNESREQDFLAMLRSRNRKEHTILKDRRGGHAKNLSLKDLREQLESGVRFADDSYRTPCKCDLAWQMPLFELA